MAWGVDPDTLDIAALQGQVARLRAEVESLRKWIYATSVSLERSGLTLDKYNAIARDVRATLEEKDGK